MKDNAFTGAMIDPAKTATALSAELATSGFVRLDTRHFGIDPGGAEFERFRAQWDDLALDEEMADGGRYRLRRYGRLRAIPAGDGFALTPLPPNAFRQDGLGIWRRRARVFALIGEPALLDPLLHTLVSTDLLIASGARPRRPWTVGLHQVRIVASGDELGRPTPEGRHRDGHRFVGMHLLRRRAVSGGRTTIYLADEQRVELMLRDPLDSMIVDDTAVWHEVSPISPAPGADQGVRDMLLVDINP